MSRERYYELYRKFLNDTISKADYEELMKWVSDDKNDALLRKYMERIMSEDEDAVTYGEDWETFKKRLFSNRATPKKNNTLTLKRFWYSAAALLILVSVSAGLYQYLFPESEIYHTAFAETKDVLLDDGSKVTLNANSRLEWTRNWKKKGERKLILTGEAFFDVRHTEDDLPFIVETEDLEVNVLGTTFNVQSRHGKTDVVLKSGKVRLNLKRVDDNILEMEPGDKVNYSSTEDILERKKIETPEAIAHWLEGILIFEDVSVEEMFVRIEDLYGKKLISADSSLLDRRIFTGIPYEDWEVTKEALELALGVKMIEKDNELRVQ